MSLLAALSVRKEGKPSPPGSPVPEVFGWHCEHTEARGPASMGIGAHMQNFSGIDEKKKKKRPTLATLMLFGNGIRLLEIDFLQCSVRVFTITDQICFMQSTTYRYATRFDIKKRHNHLLVKCVEYFDPL